MTVVGMRVGGTYSERRGLVGGSECPLLEVKIGPLLLAAVVAQLARGQKTSWLSLTHDDCEEEACQRVSMYIAVRRRRSRVSELEASGARCQTPANASAAADNRIVVSVEREEIGIILTCVVTVGSEEVVVEDFVIGRCVRTCLANLVLACAGPNFQRSLSTSHSSSNIDAWSDSQLLTHRLQSLTLQRLSLLNREGAHNAKKKKEMLRSFDLYLSAQLCLDREIYSRLPA